MYMHFSDTGKIQGMRHEVCPTTKGDVVSNPEIARVHDRTQPAILRSEPLVGLPAQVVQYIRVEYDKRFGALNPNGAVVCLVGASDSVAGRRVVEV